MSDSFQEYHSRYGSLEGWFSTESSALFDSFLTFQKILGVSGDMFEIGVAYGRSAILLAMHLDSNRTLYLNDLNDGLLASIQPMFIERNVHPRLITVSSFNVDRSTIPHRSVAFMHIDGDHGRRAQHNDLDLAHQMVSEDGIVALDDFFAPQFVGVTIGAIEWITRNPDRFQLVLTGFNKGYLCRPNHAEKYLKFIRDDLPTNLRARGVEGFTIFRMSTRDDYPGFGITPRQWDRDFVSLSTDVSIPEVHGQDKIDV